MLTDGTGAKAPAGSEQKDIQDDHDEDRRDRDRPVIEDRVDQPADERNVGDLRGNVQWVEAAGALRRARGNERVQIAGQANRGDVEDDAADDLVDAQAYREPRVQSRQK